MALQPVARRSVPDEVFDQILDDVVSGEFAPGEALPSERKLAEVLGVSRPGVREALQRVARAGLVPAVARSVLEARLLIGPKVAELAATRAGSRIEEALRRAVAAIDGDPDPVARQRHALVFWDHVVDGADSIVFLLMFNSL